jgi:phage shock protein E
MFLHTNNNQLQKTIQEGAFLVDVRSKGEYALGHADGSINIPLDELQDRLSEFNNKQNIVVFCRSGNRSSMAKCILDQNGFTNVINGGTWQAVNGLIK